MLDAGCRMQVNHRSAWLYVKLLLYPTCDLFPEISASCTIRISQTAVCRSSARPGRRGRRPHNGPLPFVAPAPPPAARPPTMISRTPRDHTDGHRYASHHQPSQCCPQITQIDADSHRNISRRNHRLCRLTQMPSQFQRQDRKEPQDHRKGHRMIDSSHRV